MVEIRENRAKHKLQRGEVVTVISGSTTGMTADIIDFLGPLGFDGAWIETEHGAVDFADIPNLTRACDLWNMTSVVRVNLNIPGVIYRTFDVGAQGIVVPHVDTVEDARRVVKGAKFGPIGARGNYTSRQGLGVENYAAKANDQTLVVVLIEDIAAINNLSEILEVDHIDVFFVAAGDLSQSMGYLDQPTHPEVQAVVDRAITQIIDAGRVAGTVAFNDAVTGDITEVERYIENGVRFFLVDWPSWLEAKARDYLAKVAAVSY